MGERSRTLGRRELLKTCGAAALFVGASSLLGKVGRAAPAPVNLSMEAALVEMVDGNRVFHWTYQLEGAAFPSFPGPTIVAFTGTEIVFRVTNHLDEPHGFAIRGVGPNGADLVSTPATIPPGGTGEVRFTPRVAGTFLYFDPRNAPVNRVLGLHGAFFVLPAGVKERTANNTPFLNPPPQVKRFFDSLGVPPEAPGDPWIPIRPSNVPPDPRLPPEIEPFLFRTRVWVVNQIDPRFNLVAEAGGSAEPGGGIDPATFTQEFLPRYFTINGKSGFFAAEDHATEIEGFVGEPFFVRMLNAGAATHSMHIHANHYRVMAINGVPQQSVWAPDTVTLNTLENDALAAASGLPDIAKGFIFGGSRIDVLVAMGRPPDIPGAFSAPLRDLLREELNIVLEGVRQSPLRYPMHDHIEMSQTAAGGNYPQGLITHVDFLGDVDKVPFPGVVLPFDPNGTCGGTGH